MYRWLRAPTPLSLPQQNRRTFPTLTPDKGVGVEIPKIFNFENESK